MHIRYQQVSPAKARNLHSQEDGAVGYHARSKLFWSFNTQQSNRKYNNDVMTQVGAKSRVNMMKCQSLS